MKRVILSAAFVMLVMTSCKQNAPTADPAPTPPPVEDPAPPARPEPTTGTTSTGNTNNNSTTTTTTTTTTEEDPDGTSVNVSRDGVDFSTKKGDNNVKLSTQTKEVQIKTTTN